MEPEVLYPMLEQTPFDRCVEIAPPIRQSIAAGAPSFAMLGVTTAGDARLGQHTESAIAQFDDLTLVADARLDNREELIASIGRDTLALVTDSHRGSPALSDADILLASYLTWGEAAPRRLRGAFAVILRDRRRQVVVAFIDPMGMRTLYRAETNAHPAASTLLATEVSQCVAHSAVTRTLDSEYWLEHLCGRPSSVRTPFAGVAPIAPGSVYTFEPGAQAQAHAYSEFASVEPTKSLDRQDHLAQFRADLDSAVARRTATQAKTVGCELSGGVDSSSVTDMAARCAKRQGKELATWTCATRTQVGQREAAIASALASALGARSRIDWLEDDPETPLWKNHTLPVDGPLASRLEVTQSRNRFLAQEGCDTILSGHGGDELFARGQRAVLHRQATRPTTSVLRTLFRELLRHVPEPLALNLIDHYRCRLPWGPSYAPRWLTHEARARARHVFAPEVARKELRKDGIRRAHATSIDPRLLATLQKRPWMGPLAAFRRETLRSGLDYLHPLLDEDLVRTALSLSLTPSFCDERHKLPLLETISDAMPKEGRTLPKTIGEGSLTQCDLRRHKDYYWKAIRESGMLEAPVMRNLVNREALAHAFQHAESAPPRSVYYLVTSAYWFRQQVY